MKKSFKYFLFPIILILLGIIMSLFRINFSSVGIYNNMLSQSPREDSNLVLGVPRSIRSDLFLVSLPMTISQDINNEWTVNKDIGEGSKLGLQTFPVKNLFALFKPSMFPYFLSNDSSLSHSLQWWIEFTLLILGTYLLLLELTNKNLAISIIGSMIFLFTPFFQWWNQTLIVTWISFGIFFFLRILKEPNVLKSILWGSGLTYSIVAFIVLLYPPFQIPVAYVAVFLALGILLNDFKKIKENIKTSSLVLLASVLLSILFVFLYIREFGDIMEITTQTVYPGERFISAGDGDSTYLFNGFYNVLLQKDSNTAPYGNQSETANFIMLFPPLIAWILYKNIQLFKKKKKLEWVGLMLSLVLLIFAAFYFFKIPDFISKYSLFYLIPPTRLMIGFGYGSYLLMLYTLSKNSYKPEKCLKDQLLLVFLAILFSVITYKTGQNLLKISPNFFTYPSFISPIYKILLATILSGVLIYLLLNKHKKIFLTLFLSFSIISTVFINPIYKGLDILINTDIAKYIQNVSRKDDAKWVIYGDHALAQYALANNASIINGVHMYPQFKIWEVLDPEKKFMDIYNRYAHVIVSEPIGGNDPIRLLQQDALILEISPCDSRLKDLGVKYVMTTIPLNDTSCLIEQEKFMDRISIYNLE